MNVLIIILLVLLIVAEVVSFYNNLFIARRNYDVFEQEKLHLKLKISNMRVELAEAERANQGLRKHKIAPALLLTEQGIKILPEGYEDAFNSLWDVKP